MRLLVALSSLVMAGSLLGCAAEAVSQNDVAETSDELFGFVPPHCSLVFSSEHKVNVGNGVKLHVLAKHSIRSLTVFPRRAILMLPPTLATNAIYDAQVPGDPTFNALDRAAREGYFAYALSYEGYGESTQPEHGGTVTAERMLQQAGKVVEWIRVNALADEVDVFGMSIGSSIAVALGGTQSPTKQRYIGRVVLSSHVYQSVTPFFEQAFFSPEFRAFLESAPNGYIETDPSVYGLLMDRVEPAAFDWAGNALAGRYATGPTLEGFDLPVFNATYGRAPALQFWGDADPVTPLSDVADFQADYGGPVDLRVIPDGAHTLHLEEGRETLFDEMFDFLDEGRTPVPTLGCPG